MSLTHQSRSAVFWSGADGFLRQGLQFFVLILLARMLMTRRWDELLD
jgi:O-antigen/teichoic acid export membrane protein